MEGEKKEKIKETGRGEEEGNLEEMERKKGQYIPWTMENDTCSPFIYKYIYIYIYVCVSK